MKLNKEHISILEHTINRPAGSPYCGDRKETDELCEVGFMRYVGKKPFVSDPYYGITNEGRKALVEQTSENKKSKTPELDKLLDHANKLKVLQIFQP